jgi:hypothetical protein
MQENSSLHKTDAREQLSTQGRCKRPALSYTQDRCKRPALFTGQMQEASSPQDTCKRPALSSLQRTDAGYQLSPQDRCKRQALSSLHKTDARDKLCPQDRCKRQVLSSQTDRSALSIMLDKEVGSFHRINMYFGSVTRDQLCRMDRHKVNSVHRIRYKRSALSEWINTKSILCIRSDTRDQLCPNR